MRKTLGTITRIDAQENRDMRYYVRDTDTLNVHFGPTSLVNAENMAQVLAARGHDVDVVSGAFV